MAETLESTVRVEERFVEPEKSVDREKSCPLLLRVFCCTGQHNSIIEYRNGNVPANGIQVVAWMDFTLRELTSLVMQVNPEARRKGTMFDFSVVFRNPVTTDYRFRDTSIGSTISGQKGPDDSKTLSQIRFNIGDYMDVCITPPQGMNPPMTLLRGMRRIKQS